MLSGLLSARDCYYHKETIESRRDVEAMVIDTNMLYIDGYKL